MFEAEIEMTQEMEDAIAFYRELVEDATYGDAATEIRVEVMESDTALLLALRYILNDQLWENQIDMYGRKLPRYKPDTIRKKAKLGHPADKLVNYTERWTGAFYQEGVYVEVDAARDQYTFENTFSRSYFQYIPEDVFGMTDENFESYQSLMSLEVERAQKRYINRRVRESQYAEILQGLMFLGYDFGY